MAAQGKFPCMDLTTLSGDDTDERVRRLCAKARQPVQQNLAQKLEIRRTRSESCRHVCVYHVFVETALHALKEAACALPVDRVHRLSGWAFAASRTGR